MKSIIPNSFTLSNLLCGCLALISIFNGEIELVPIFWAVALFMDYTDGLVARLLKVSSDLGKELDSLADMVSFGVVPGALLFYLINQTMHIERVDFHDINTLWGVIGFLVTLFSCLRLAKFNLDDRQADTFIGLNTPSCTTFVLGLSLCAYYDLYDLRSFILQMPLLVLLAVILSYLLVAEIPMFSFKFKNLSWASNRYRYALIALIVTLLVTLQFGAALAGIVISYVVFSLALWALGELRMPKRNN